VGTSMVRDRAEALIDFHSPYDDASLKNHCLRIIELTLALGRADGVSLDEDLVHVAGQLHDIGLFITDPSEPSYLRRGFHYAEPHLEAWGFDGTSVELIRQMMLFNHSFVPVSELAEPAEIFRKAVHIEHSYGARRFGLKGHVVRAIIRAYPRLRLNSVLLDFAKTVVLDDGATQLYDIFMPRWSS